MTSDPPAKLLFGESGVARGRLDLVGDVSTARFQPSHAPLMGISVVVPKSCSCFRLSEVGVED